MRPFGRQKPMSQKGIDAAMTGSVAASTGTPSARLSAAAVATEDASPPAVHASVLAESLPTTFSVYSPMSLWTATLSIGSPLRGKPARVEHAEVDGGGDDDRAAGDGRYRARYGCAALLLADGEAERDGAPYDEEAPQEGHASRDQVDDVRQHQASLLSMYSE